MASSCVPEKWRKAGRIGTEEAVKVYLIIFIADLPLRLVLYKGCVNEYL